jgi:DNA primase large subunit
MCQSLAAVCHPYSAETQYVRESVKKILRYRLYDLFKRGEDEFCIGAIRKTINLLSLEEFTKYRGSIPESDYYRLRDIRMKKDGIKEVDQILLPQFLPKWAVRWTDVALVFRHNRASLTDFYLVDGWMVLTVRDLWDLFAELVGDQTEEYIQSVYERMVERGKPEKLVEIGEEIVRQIPKTADRLTEVQRVAGRLNPEYFPPCIHNVLRGVGSGLRNFSVVMLLTSFLSYARIAPSGRRGEKITDFIKDFSIITDEIVPLIMEAAERCNPPLFSDQPQEKANIFYHLGLGMTTNPRPQDAGRSKWYMVPNCAKIQASAPPLCQPDELCKKIKNPLTYYFRKRAERAGGRKR